MKTIENTKLILNKTTVSTLTDEKQKSILAGAAEIPPCWENLWSLYHCDVIYTGDKDPREETQAQAVQQVQRGA